jgi:hypothetical protein
MYFLRDSIRLVCDLTLLFFGGARDRVAVFFQFFQSRTQTFDTLAHRLEAHQLYLFSEFVSHPTLCVARIMPKQYQLAEKFQLN